MQGRINEDCGDKTIDSTREYLPVCVCVCVNHVKTADSETNKDTLVIVYSYQQDITNYRITGKDVDI